MENSNPEFEKDLNEELAEIAEKYEDKNYFQRLRDTTRPSTRRRARSCSARRRPSSRSYPCCFS